MYDEKFPTAIVKAQIDIINVFLAFASIAFIIGILVLIFSKEKKIFGVPMIIIPSMLFFMSMINNADFKNKLNSFMQPLFDFFYNYGFILVAIFGTVFFIFCFIILPFFDKEGKGTSFGSGLFLGWLLFGGDSDD